MNHENSWSFEAYGNTYSHREKLKEWAWFWKPEKKCWYIESGQAVEPDDINVLWVRDLPGVTVKALNETTGVVTTLDPTGVKD